MAQVEGYILPDELYYDRKDHIWAKIEEEGRVRVGLDMFGQKAAGTIAYLKLLPVGRSVEKLRVFGTLEAGKYVGPLKAPVGGKVVEMNEEVVAQPSLIHEDPYGRGWLVAIEPSRLEEDLQDLAHGDQVQPWLENEITTYREKGLLKED